MDYRATTPFQTPPVPVTAAAYAAAAEALKWNSFQGLSGDSGIIIPGEYQTVKLISLKATWNGILSLGQIIITMPDRMPIIILQTHEGSTDYNFIETPVALEDYGIRVANNSAGGQYNVTIFFRLA